MRNDSRGSQATAHQHPIITLDSAPPFSSEALELSQQASVVHEMRARLNTLFQSDELVEYRNDRVADRERRWAVLPLITVQHEDRQYSFRLVRRADLQNDPDKTEDTPLVIGDNLDKPELLYDVETGFLPHEKIIDLASTNLDTGDIDDPEQVNFFDQIITTYEIMLAKQRQDLARETRATHDSRIGLLRRIGMRVGGSILALCLLGGIAKGGQEIYEAVHDTPVDVAHDYAKQQILTLALPNRTYVPSGKTVKLVELKNGTTVVTLQENAAVSGGQDLAISAEDPITSELVAAADAGDMGKVVQFDLPTEKGECTIVAMPSPSAKSTRVSGAYVATGSGAPGDYTVEVIRKKATIDSETTSETTAVHGIAKVCMTRPMKDDPAEPTIETGFIRMVTTKDAPRG